jgi:hypothetical protein
MLKKSIILNLYRTPKKEFHKKGKQGGSFLHFYCGTVGGRKHFPEKYCMVPPAKPPGKMPRGPFSFFVIDYKKINNYRTPFDY